MEMRRNEETKTTRNSETDNCLFSWADLIRG